MKIGKLLFTLLLGFGLVTAISCGGDDEGDNDDGGNVNGFDCNNLESFSETFQNVLNAATDYSSDPTSETCNAYLDALEDYFDDLTAILDCPGVTEADRADFQESLDEAETAIEETRTTCASLN